nr:hypothetical protein [uncultured Undibacterium sp.]
MIIEKNHVEINEFLQDKGISLVEFGSAELALCKIDAISFLAMIEKFGIRPLGIEVWNKVDGGWSINSLGGWYSENVEVDSKDAMDFVGSKLVADSDVVTIQF